MNFRGKTVAEATATALKDLGVQESELEIKVVQEPARGILGIGQKDAIIEVSYKGTSIAELVDMTLEAPIEPKPEPTQEKTVEAKPETKSAENDQPKKKKVEKATSFLKEMINQLGYQVEYFIREEQGFVIINIRGKSAGKLIGKRGETLYAIQYLVNIVANRNDDNNVKFLIDIEDFRKQREKTLSNLAIKLAGQVKATGEAVALEPMNPLERKIIHVALQKDSAITTTSEGEEGRRHIVISLKAQN